MDKEDYIEERIGETEEELLNAGYTYRDIEDASTAILAAISEDEEEAREILKKKFTKDKYFLLFYIVGETEGFRKGFLEGTMWINA